MKPSALKDSSNLLADYPSLAEQAGWNEFVAEFDGLECIKNRSKALKAYRKEMGDSVRELHDLCRMILNGEVLALFRRTKSDGTRGYSSCEEVARDRMVAAVGLAEKVELLLSDSDGGKKLRYALNSEARRRGTPPLKRDKGNNSALVCYAFLGFVHREERLPSKKELNIEANRLAHSQDGFLGERKFSEIFIPNDAGSGNRVSQYRVYDCALKFNRLGDYKSEMRMEFRIVPACHWDKPRWVENSGLSEFTTPLGLKGLPEAHEAKGNKVRK